VWDEQRKGRCRESTILAKNVYTRYDSSTGRYTLPNEHAFALGAQAGEARMRETVMKGGFTRFRRAAETPFNLVYETRP
jgi:hypothetical protein